MPSPLPGWICKRLQTRLSFYFLSFVHMLIIFLHGCLGFCVIVGCSYGMFSFVSSDQLRRLSVLHQSGDWLGMTNNVSSMTLNPPYFSLLHRRIQLIAKFAFILLYLILCCFTISGFNRVRMCLDFHLFVTFSGLLSHVVVAMSVSVCLSHTVVN